MERPILFSTEMVRAILDKRKTQTRRIIKYCIRNDSGNFLNSKYEVIRPPYAVGDTLWVRETWGYYTETFGDATYFEYKASFNPQYDEEHTVDAPKWRPSIHMPREACRLFLKVTNVRAERLQDITNEDARAEGLDIGYTNTDLYNNSKSYKLLADNLSKSRFADLWDKIYEPQGKGWNENPWVWVIEFERVSL